MRSRTIFLALFALVATCGPPDYGYAVRVDIDFSSSVTDDMLVRVGSLRLRFFGAESGTRTIPLDTGFLKGRQARFVYYPGVPSGRVAVAVTATDTDGGVVATGQSSVELVPGKTVALVVRLRAGSQPAAFAVN